MVPRGEQVPTRPREPGSDRVQVAGTEREEALVRERLVALRQLTCRIERVLDVVPHGDHLEGTGLFDGRDSAEPQGNVELAPSPLDDVRSNVDSLRLPAGAGRLVDEEARGGADVEQASSRCCESSDQGEAALRCLSVPFCVGEVVRVSVCRVFSRGLEIVGGVDALQLVGRGKPRTHQHPAVRTRNEVEPVLSRRRSKRASTDHARMKLSSHARGSVQRGTSAEREPPRGCGRCRRRAHRSSSS